MACVGRWLWLKLVPFEPHGWRLRVPAWLNRLLVRSYDHDKDGANDDAQDFIGSSETSVGEMVGIHRGTYTTVRVYVDNSCWDTPLPSHVNGC